MRNKLIILFSLFAILDSDAQNTFQKMYSASGIGDIGQNLVQTLDDGYLLTGYSYLDSTNYNPYCFIIKTDSFGDTLWTAILGDTSNNKGYVVVEQHDSTVIAIGNNNMNIFLSKLSSDGRSIWNKIISRDSINFMYPNACKTNNGGLIISTTAVNPFISGETNLFVINLDSSGSVIWAKSFDKVGRSTWSQIKKTKDNCFVITGSVYDQGSPNEDVLLLKIDISGNLVWNRLYDFGFNDFGVSVSQTKDDGFIIGGKRFLDNSLNYEAVFLIKTDSAGYEQWAKTYDTGGAAEFSNVEETVDSGFIFLSLLPIYIPFNGELTLVKTNSIGDTLWTSIFAGGNLFLFESACYNSDNTYSIFSGRRDSFGIWKSYLIKTNSIGKVGCFESIRSMDVILNTVQTYIYAPNTLSSFVSQIPANFNLNRGITEEVLCL